jgi:hypothetical protein
MTYQQKRRLMDFVVAVSTLFILARFLILEALEMWSFLRHLASA